MSDNDFRALLSAGKIADLELRNRLVVTAMGASLAEIDGQCGERIIRYHEEQARGGVGLIITGVAGVAWPVGGNQSNQIAISEDRFIPGLTALTAAVHAHGAKIAAQLHHGGLVGMEDMIAGRPVWGPSEPKPPASDFTEAFLLEELAAAPFSRVICTDTKVMTKADIALVVRQFADAAIRAARAGFDGVEVHGGHGYLLSSFLSATTNQRGDAYGGSLENRARFLIEVLQAVRKAVGADFPVWCKLDSREVGKTGGLTIEDAIATARLVQAAGVNAITVTAYHDTEQARLHSGSHTPHEPASNLPFARRIRQAVNVPVIASGRIEPEVAERAIAGGEIDFVSMGRKLLADPHLPRKLTAGRPEDVRPCIYCYTCISAIYLGDPMRCAVNQETGREYLRSPATGPKRRIVVIGGGPGGMEAACLLDADGHDVTLIEQSGKLGGTLRFAALGYEPNQRLLEWLIRRLAASGVTVRLSTSADLALIASIKPDTVIVATGAVRNMPAIPGSDRPNVFSGDDLRSLMAGGSTALKGKTSIGARALSKLGTMLGLTANPGFVRQASRYWMPLGKQIVIVGGELVGLELAEFLAERGRKVTVVEEGPRLGKGLTVVRRMRLLADLKDEHVALHAGCTEIRIGERSLQFVDMNGVAKSVVADHVIVAKGASPNLGLADALDGAGYDVHRIGDCQGVGYIEGAIRDATTAAAAISGRVAPVPAAAAFSAKVDA